MPENFISLKCQSCGGKLDVYEDMERFACGYCGTEMIGQRRSGTVALKLVQEAIKKVQVGTDKTAAELALVRLDDELKALNSKASRLRNTKEEFMIGFGSILAFTGLMLFIGAVNAGEIGLVVLTIFLIGGRIFIIFDGRSLSLSPEPEFEKV